MNISKYNLQNLKRVANPKGISGVVSHYGTNINRKYHGRTSSTEGTYVVEEDWDNLLILDGCRFDTFAERCDLDGKSEHRRSLGSESGEFIRENFIGRDIHDTVYITSNPFTSSIPEETFHYVENLLETEWDANLETVPPEKVADRTQAAADRFSNKRLIGHFMQPHFPFIGERGQQLETGGINPEKGETSDSTPIWKRLQYGLDVTKEEVQEAYEENLDVVLSVVDSLLDDLDGKTVITADHGNLIGDRLSPLPVRGYGHPSGLYVDPLVVVPWFVIDGDRREITSDKPVSSERLADENIGERLEALGYK